MSSDLAVEPMISPEDAAASIATPSQNRPVVSERAAGDVVIDVRSVSKSYRIYAKPIDRFKQAFAWGRRQYFKEFRALSEVNFQVRAGEMVAVIGRNGGGKSTLLQMIAGTLTPTSGSILVPGRIAALLELGSGFQPEATGRENVYMNGAILGLSRAEIEQKFDAIAAFADIGEFIDQPVKTYSSGMFVRLAFAVAAHVDAEVIMIDEALAVGDIFFQQKCIRHMREKLAGKTKILVTHDMHAVSSMADRVVVLDKGRLVFDGEPLEGIEFFTKLVHDETFGAAQRSPALEAGGQIGSPQRARSLSDGIPWIDVSPESRGGAGEVWFERVALTGRDGQPASALGVGESGTIWSLIRSSAPKHELIFGYMLNDRFASPICGENTCSLRQAATVLPGPGLYRVRIDFVVPQMRPGEYTITLGIGEGSDPLHHVIQCWGHNVLRLSVISPRRVIHGLFNNPIERFEVTPL